MTEINDIDLYDEDDELFSTLDSIVVKLDSIEQRLTRLETRQCKQMVHAGLDPKTGAAPTTLRRKTH